MRKALYLTAGSALAVALLAAAPASADVFVAVTFTKDKDVFVYEQIVKSKLVTVDVTSALVPEGAAEAMAVVNAINIGNEVNGSNGNAVPGGGPNLVNDPNVDYDIFLRADILGSINANSGIAGVNQDVGNMTNQGNVVALSALDDIVAAPSLTHSQAEVEQANSGNIVFDSEWLSVAGDPVASAPNKVATIIDSINGNTGIVGVNQNAGNMNNQHNVVAMAVGFGGLVALSEAALGQSNTGNVVTEIETIKLGLIAGSVNGNSGVVGVNQSTGNMNNQASVVSFSALTSNAVIGVPGS